MCTRKRGVVLSYNIEEEGLYDRAILYATDINQKALATAREATYSIEDVIGFTQNYYFSGGKEDFRKYYTVDWDNNVVHFNKSLLRNIYFSVHNLVSDKVFNEFEIIFCRNVFIYFNKELQERSLRLLKDSLVYRGYLFLGDSGNINFKGITENFRIVDKKYKIYKKSKIAMK
jgi:chemotaxis protein methyltransferase CheR